MRRQQAKQSAIEAREAMLRQKEDNYSVANLMREQAEAIKAQKELEREVEMELEWDVEMELEGEMELEWDGEMELEWG